MASRTDRSRHSNRVPPSGSALVLALTGVVFLLAPLPAPAQEVPAPRPIRFARHPSLSPDGRQIAFSYLGDLWTVDSAGGTAARVTIHEAHDQLPAFSPDGRWLAFSSKREGNYVVWVIPSVGGPARQLTFHSADDQVNGWTPDGTQILFASNRETTRTTALYTVEIKTGASRLVARDDFPLNNGRISPDGEWVAATRGGTWSRRGYRGSASGDLMLFPLAGGPGRWLTRNPENQRWPLFSRDGRQVYFASDHEGAANLYRMPVESSPAGPPPVPVTRHRDGSLYYPTLSGNSERIVYERNFGLWTLNARGGEPRELRILAPSDDRTNPRRLQTFAAGAQAARLSPDGKQVAIIIRGELWVQPVAGGDAIRLSDTPQREEDPDWAPGGGQIAFTSDRDGNNDLFVVDLKTKETRQLTHTSALAEHTPRYSPDGKSIAFLRGYNGAQLCCMPAEGGEARVLVDDPAIGDPAWSPDSRWLAYGRMKAHSAGTQADVFLVASEGGKPVNVTRYPVVNTGPVWSGDGKRLFFRSNRTANPNVWALALQDTGPDEGERERGTGVMERAPFGAASDGMLRTGLFGIRITPSLNDSITPPAVAATGQDPGARKPVEVKIDFDDIHLRARQVTRSESAAGSFAVSPDSRTVVFSMSQLGRPDLWRVAATGGTPARLTQTGESGSGLEFTADGAQVVYLSAGALKRLALSAPAPVPIAFSVRMEIDARGELRQMFDEAWRKTRDSFYDEKLHGADWDRIRASYGPIVEGITYKEDFYALFSLVLGELNASHTGISGPPGGGGLTTASLGIALDDTYAGPGVRVRSVIPKGPADARRAGAENALKPGDLILKMGGERITINEQFYRLLGDQAGKQVELQVNAEPGMYVARTVKLRAISAGEYRRLEYDRWVREREAQTEKLSGGRLGYLHLNAMNEANLEKFKRAVFSDMQEKDGLVIDVRFNGGGGIADEMLAIMQDRVFSYRTMRGDARRLTAPLLAWTKPTIVLINEASFSNAEVFPWGYKALGLGKVVGMPTYGAVIGTGGTTLIDGSSLRIPALGSYTLDGLNMENNGCPPDIAVENTPEDVHAGRDRQLEHAVSALLETTRADTRRGAK